MHPSSNLHGIIFALIGFTAFSFSDALFKYVGAAHSVFIMVFWNAVFGALTALTLSLFRGGIRKNLTPVNLKMHGVRAVFVILNILFFIYGLVLLPMAKAYALIFTAPFMTVILSAFLLKEKVDKSRLVAVILGFAGVLVILRPGAVPLDVGTVSILVAALSFALLNICSRYMGNKEPPLTFSFYPHLVMMTLCGIVAGYQSWEWPSGTTLALLAMTGVLSMMGQIFLAQAFVRSPSGVVAPFHYVQMVWAAAIGWFAFQEIPDSWVTAGATIIIASGLYLIYRENRVHKKIAL